MKSYLLLSGLLIINAVISQPAMPKPEVKLLNRVIEKNHFSPRVLDDQFSASLFDHIISQLDVNKQYLTQQDLKGLETWRLKLDDEIQANNLDFIDQLTAVWTKALANANEIIAKLETVPVKFDKPGTYTYSEQTPFAADATALKERWNQYFTYKLLSDLYETHEFDSTAVALSQLVKEEPAARKSVAAALLKKNAKKLADEKEIKTDLTHLYFNSIANLYDPHTEFFEPEEKAHFDESLSSERLMFGFAMTEKDGGYSISSLVPGSPAWNSGSMHVNDKITEIKGADGTTLKIGEASDQQINKVFNDPAAQMEITVQSADGKTNTVKLKKELISNDENFVKGYILTHNGKKTGYIALPSFYSQWDVEGSTSCANDVSKEIVKLKKEGIEALLLDLRYNGGGSLQEALELSGVFIDAGPLSLVRETGGKTYILKDPARGTIYDGPMGVMINGQSASASELVAGALQDYNRAVIIGGSSFGKATMQIVLPMDSNYNYATASHTYKPNEAKGFVKVTTGKLYRINGKTNQLNGVVPDIALPDAVEAYDYTERKMPFAMPADTVIKYVVYSALPQLPVSSLAKKSNERINAAPYFQSMSGYITRMKKAYTEKSIPLQWENYKKWAKSIASADLADLDIASKYFTISNSTLDNRIMQLDGYQKELNDELKEDILNDSYIEEALKIMEDLIKKPA